MTVGRKLLASFQKFIQRLLFTCSLVKSGMQWHEMSTENAPTGNAGNSPLFFHQNESLLIKRSGGVLFTATDPIKCPSHQFLNLHAHVQKDNGLRARYPFRRTQLAMLVFLCGFKSWQFDDMHLKRQKTTAFLFSRPALSSRNVWDKFKFVVTTKNGC